MNFWKTWPTPLEAILDPFARVIWWGNLKGDKKENRELLPTNQHSTLLKNLRTLTIDFEGKIKWIIKDKQNKIQTCEGERKTWPTPLEAILDPFARVIWWGNLKGDKKENR